MKRAPDIWSGQAVQSGAVLSPRRSLKRAVDGVSGKVLADRVRELEAAGVLRRTVHAEMPVRVVYELTPLGYDLRPVVAALADWGDQLAEPRSGRRRRQPART